MASFVHVPSERLLISIVSDILLTLDKCSHGNIWVSHLSCPHQNNSLRCASGISMPIRIASEPPQCFPHPPDSIRMIPDPPQYFSYLLGQSEELLISHNTSDTLPADQDSPPSRAESFHFCLVLSEPSSGPSPRPCVPGSQVLPLLKDQFLPAGCLERESSSPTPYSRYRKSLGI